MTSRSGLSSSSTLNDWLAWQERSHTSEIDLGLARVNLVYQRLCKDQQGSIFTITVAGTNGKGSSVALLETILLAAGYSVGVYSTPHLHDYNERIRINGVAVESDLITTSFTAIDQARLNVSLSYFEFGTLAALDIFAKNTVDIQILEVGLGGRLDAVNIVDADAALITSIALDHMDWLGSDISSIAFEKAGIFRPQQKAVCGDSTVPLTLINHAQTLQTDLICAGTDFDVLIAESSWELIADHRLAGNYPMPALKGQHQVQNAAAVITLLAHIGSQLAISKKHINDGLANVSLQGRLQLIAGQPAILLDVAHNPEAAQVLANYVSEQNDYGDIRVVFSILADKDLAGVVLPFQSKVKKWYIAPIETNRAQPVTTINNAILRGSAADCEIFESISLAFQTARAEAATNDLIVCFGSFYVVEACLETL